MGRARRRVARRLERKATEGLIARELEAEVVRMGCTCDKPLRGRVTRNPGGRVAVARLQHRAGCPALARARAGNN